jgi:hypothetical protein
MNMLQEPNPGDHLVSPRSGYTHHGIYIGNGKVIHYSGLADGLETGPVAETTLKAFNNGRNFTVRQYITPRFQGQAVVERACSRVGEELYCVYSNNCEHFCQWCINGDHDSTQVNNGAAITSGTVVTLVGVAARSIVLTEAVAATGAVGAGAAAGLGLLGTAPALGMAYIMSNTILKDGHSLDEPERDARAVGRTATYIGAAAGTAGSLAAVSASGAIAGLSGTGITSGLVAIGGSVGGGMVSGAVLATAAPVAAAAAIGYGVYRLIKYIKQ